MEQQEFDQLIDECKKCVESGDVEYMKYLGDLYYHGLSGHDENVTDALPYWKMAADNGDNEIALKVGLCMIAGTGCEQNEEGGFSYIEKSAKAGNAEAQYYAGLCYIDGTGTYKNLSYGKQFLLMAALQNHAQAQMNLARVLLHNSGTENNLPDAIHWLCCAHLNGIEDATNSLKTVMGDDSVAAFVQERLNYIRNYGVEPPKGVEKYSSASNQSNEGCYIATAVYGSYEADEVMVLRDFRDKFLRKHCLGRIFIRAYYFISPPIAEKLKYADRTNRLVKKILNRFIDMLQESGF